MYSATSLIVYIYLAIYLRCRGDSCVLCQQRLASPGLVWSGLVCSNCYCISLKSRAALRLLWGSCSPLNLFAHPPTCSTCMYPLGGSTVYPWGAAVPVRVYMHLPFIPASSALSFLFYFYFYFHFYFRSRCWLKLKRCFSILLRVFILFSLHLLFNACRDFMLHVV